MEVMSCGDTVPVTPEHPTTPLEQMEEDDMRRLHPILPSNAALDAASDNGILLTDEQHRVLTSQSEGSTILYRPRENRQQVEGDDPRPRRTSNRGKAQRDKCHSRARKNNRSDPARRSTYITGVCARTRKLARDQPISRRSMSKPIACMLGDGKAPRLSKVHCDRDSVCVKTDT